jgi:hypothetical protein
MLTERFNALKEYVIEAPKVGFYACSVLYAFSFFVVPQPTREA